MSEPKQIAYLTVYFPGDNLNYNNLTNQVRYKTDSFEEVFKFKKKCIEWQKNYPEVNFAYTVRFKQVKTTETSYLNISTKNVVKSIKSFLNKKVF
jgi:hypothetical protein